MRVLLKNTVFFQLTSVKVTSSFLYCKDSKCFFKFLNNYKTIHIFQFNRYSKVDIHTMCHTKGYTLLIFY